MEQNNPDAVTIFRTWLDLAETLPGDAARGRFYHAICRYAMLGETPTLDGQLQIYFNLIRPVIDKSVARRNAQRNAVQKRLQNSLQNGLQNDSQNAAEAADKPACNPVDNPACKPVDKPACKLVCHIQEQEQEKKRDPEGSPKESVDVPPRNVSSDIRLPAEIDTPEIREAWSRWLAYRKSKRKPVSAQAAQMQFKLLREFPAQAVEIIDFSIMQDYQGLFPPRQRPAAVRLSPAKKDYSGI